MPTADRAADGGFPRFLPPCRHSARFVKSSPSASLSASEASSARIRWRSSQPSGIPSPSLSTSASHPRRSTAPSACNRQYVRVHCLSGKRQIAGVLALQNGNRGFGHLADKLLVVTADLEGITGVEERNDLFTNGGMFLMNLSYALHYHGIGHCILNWSVNPLRDQELRGVVELAPSECVVALLACGIPPGEFDVAASPRKAVDDLFVPHGG